MEGHDQHHRKSRVLIAGAGIAGIETALALRHLAGDLVEVELRDPRRTFSFRPFAVGEPYGAARVFRYDLERLTECCGASFRSDGIASVDAERRTASTRDGESLAYDYVVVASGVRTLWAVPGAVTFWGVADEGQVGDVIAELRAGALGRLVFTMPAGCGWPLPLYELALLGATELAKAGMTGTQLTIVTPEDAPVALWGHRASEQMEQLLEERGIEVIAGAHPVKFDAGCLRIVPGEEVKADAVISLPRLEGRRIDGIPHDSRGFIGVDEHGRVLGMQGAYAAGDITAFPVKQGGIATQQADAVAEAIACDAGAGVDPHPFDPVLRGVLWTGREPRYLYGRMLEGRGEMSSIEQSPQGSPRNGKVAGRYLTPFLDSLAAADPVSLFDTPSVH